MMIKRETLVGLMAIQVKIAKCIDTKNYGFDIKKAPMFFDIKKTPMFLT